MSQHYPPGAATTSSPGWYPDPNQPGLRYWDGMAWSSHVAAVPAPSEPGVLPATAWSDPWAEARADELAQGIATYQRVSGALWIVLGVFQVLSLWFAIAGVWNIVAGISRLGIAPAIQRRESRIPSDFHGIVGLVLIGLVNLFFGAVLGLVMVALDFYVRQRVLDNWRIFNK